MSAPSEPASAQSESSLLVVDLDKRQSRKKVKALREGRGKLFKRIEGIVADLVAEGTIKAGSQPVVIIVREEAPPPSPVPMFWPPFPT
jgi:hypothetical protein